MCLTATTTGERAPQTAGERAEEALWGDGAAPERGGEEACWERAGTYVHTNAHPLSYMTNCGFWSLLLMK